MRFKLWYAAIGLLLTLLLTSTQAIQAQETTPPPTPAAGPNLLENPGFEGIGKPVDNRMPNPDNWTRDTFNAVPYSEIFTPEGWSIWWKEGDGYGRPECKVIPNEPPFNIAPIRIHAGYYSVLCFGFYRKLHAGAYQVVRGIPPDSVVEGTFMAHAWSCSEDNPPLSCGDMVGFYFRVGIDPNGDTDPFSENIVWSEPDYHHDKFARVGPVQATVGITGVATLFIEATAKWPYKHNDAYWDNAGLRVVVTGTLPTATPPPPPPTFVPLPPPQTPQPTPTPLPDGAIVHTVVEGDTWLGIALLYGVDVSELIRLNAGTFAMNRPITVGQPVVVQVNARAESTLPTTMTVGAPPVTGLAPEYPAGDMGTICVLAFDDANDDNVWQSDNNEETVVSDAEIALVGADGSVSIYRTDSSGTHCFQNVTTGQFYLVQHTPPQGYTTDFGPWRLYLSGGQVHHIALAYKRAQTAPSPIPSSLAPLLRISGGLSLFLAIGIGIRFTRSRRA